MMSFKFFWNLTLVEDIVFGPLDKSHFHYFWYFLIFKVEKVNHVRRYKKMIPKKMVRKIKLYLA